MGTAPGYRQEKTAQTGRQQTPTRQRTANTETAGVERRGAAVRGDAVGRHLEEVRREFSGLPVYVGVGGLWTRGSSGDT
jgi:hypothetical protein